MRMLSKADAQIHNSRVEERPEAVTQKLFLNFYFRHTTDADPMAFDSDCKTIELYSPTRSIY
jgi:hypothetical protein